jgi:hypothetical protein
MFIKLTEVEFNDHLDQGFGGEDADCSFTRLGVRVNQWDNGAGCGLLMLSSVETDKVTFLHYE